MRTARWIISLLLSASAFAQDPRLVLSSAHPFSTRPGATVPFELFVDSVGTQDVEQATLRLQLPPGSQVFELIQPAGWNCSPDASAIVCEIPRIRVEDEIARVAFGLRISEDRTGGAYELPFTVTAKNASAEETLRIVVARLIRVSTTADSGAGSFREALLEANEHCTQGLDCEIGFDLADGATFEPLTPLPAITACGSIFINGGKYDHRQGDRLYELSGARLTGKGSGLDYRPICRRVSGLNVQGLAINRFPDDGITMSPVNLEEAQVLISGAFIGTDRTGREARPNGLRGITAYSSSVRLFVSTSIFSGNGRSGVFLWDIAHGSFIDNRIGASVDRQPLSNGAAGIFLRRGSLSLGGNIIAHNHDFGLALVRGAEATLYPGNSIFANDFVGIDWGLDGPTRVGSEADGVPNAPRITSAVYDPATNITTVRGIVAIDRPLGSTYYVQLFSSTMANARGEWEGEIQHGAWREPFQPLGQPGTYEWEIREQGDLRGRVVTTIVSVASFPELTPRIMSEFSNAIAVR